MGDWDDFNDEDPEDDEWPWWAQIGFILVAGSGIWALIALGYLVVAAWLF